jgi:hypothetical protein
MVPPAPEGVVRARPAAKRAPTCTVFQVVAPPTWFGEFWSVVVPMPNCPSLLSPQHHSVPSVRVAQVVLPPASAARQVVRTPVWAGTPDPKLFPPPSWPWSELPQHHSVPSVLVAHA